MLHSGRKNIFNFFFKDLFQEVYFFFPKLQWDKANFQFLFFPMNHKILFLGSMLLIAVDPEWFTLLINFHNASTGDRDFLKPISEKVK